MTLIFVRDNDEDSCLFPAVGGEVEDEDSEEGDAHARDDQVHLHITQNPPEAS